MQLSRAQRLIKWFTSASQFEKLMNQSKKWKFTCPCGKTSSIWDIGGIRGATGGKPLSWVKCPHCGKGGMRKLIKEDAKNIQ